jgi:hypothetical protein
MSEPASEDSETKKPTKPDDAPSKGDIAALGIGCLVFLLFFVAIVMVGASRD